MRRLGCRFLATQHKSKLQKELAMKLILTALIIGVYYAQKISICFINGHSISVTDNQGY
jgi:uncharacterized membrane protein